jgi:hypothetical protein
VSTARLDRQRALRTAQIIAGLYSAIFLGTIWFGYYLLFQKDILLALFLATVLALTAWFLARYVGSEPNGIRRFLPLFIMLLIISAVGVFNSLMLNLEGRHIFAETIEGSIDQFTQLESTASKALVQRGVADHLGRVNDLEGALTSEIKNPLNCGQGPVAQRIISQLKDELPGFQELSSTGIDCSKNDQVIADYHAKIAQLVDTAPWNRPDLMAVRRDAGEQKDKLQKLASSTQGMFAPTLLRVAAPALQNADDNYRADRDKLSRQDVDVSGLPSKLNLDQINSLGEWSQLLNLIIDRLNKISTYVYLALAGFFDWMMVYLFGLVRLNRGSKGGVRAGSGSLQGAW